MESTTKQAVQSLGDHRPDTLDDFVGQEDLKRILKDEVDAGIATGRPLPHMGLYGPPGTGKTTLPTLLAKVRGIDPPIRVIGSTLNMDTLSRIFGADERAPRGTFVSADGYVASRPPRYDEHGHTVIVRSHRPTRPSMVVIDEAEAVSRDLYEGILHDVMEPGLPRWIRMKIPGSGDHQPVWVPPCTVVLITNFLGDIKKQSPAIIDRLEIVAQFKPYEIEEIMTIIRGNVARNGISIDDDAIYEIAVRSGGIPRRAVDNFLPRAVNRLLAMRHRGETDTDTITKQIVLDAFDNLKIDRIGLTGSQQQYLEALYRTTTGKMSLAGLASVMNEDNKTLQADVEPMLLQNRLIEISGTGRKITDEGRRHMEFADISYDNPDYAFSRRSSGG